MSENTNHSEIQGLQRGNAPTKPSFKETKSEEDVAESPYSLGASRDGLGELSPVLLDAYGNIIDGFHRKGESANWHSVTVHHIDNPVKLEMARLAVNYARRRVTPEEFSQRIAFLIKAGLKPEEIAKKTGIGTRTIYKYTPQELKDQKMIEAGRKAHHHEYGLAAPVQLDKRKDSEEADEPSHEEPKPSKPVDHESIGVCCPICGVGMPRDKYERLKKKFGEKYPELFTDTVDLNKQHAYGVYVE
jgi:hypothetical protein